MKKILLIVCLLAGLALSRAQTNNTSSTFLNSVVGYFTSFNTNLDTTFGASKGALWAGVDSLQGADVPLANSLGISYNAYKLISVEAVTRNGGVSGTLISQQLGIGVNFIVHDAKLTLYGAGGYQFYDPASTDLAFKERLFGEIGVRASKALSEHTFLYVGIAGQFPVNRQVFTAGMGFTF